MTHQKSWWAPALHSWDMPWPGCHISGVQSMGIGVLVQPYWVSAPLYLFCLQGQLYEDLLQFLVHKVNAELLKTIFL